MPGPGGFHGGGPGGPGGPGGRGGPGGHHGPGGGYRGPGGPGGYRGPGGGHMPPPRPPRNYGGWGRGRSYYGGGPGCCGCAAPVMTLAVIAVFALAMLIF